MNWHESDDSSVRREGCKKALESGDRSAIPALASLLADPDRGVQDAAFEALHGFGGKETAEAVLPCLGSPNERMRNLAREVLAPLAEPYPEIFLPYLQSPDADVRIFIVELLSRWKDQRSLSEITPLVNDEHPNVRSQVAITLGDLGFPEGADLLVRLVADEEDWVRLAAIEALGKISGSVSMETLVRVAKEGDALLSGCAVDALLLQRDPRVPEIVLGLLPRIADDPAACSQAIASILDILEAHPDVKIPAEAIELARPVFESIIEKGGVWDKVRAIRMLQAVDDRAAVPLLFSLFDKGEVPPLLVAIEAVGKMQPADAEDRLKKLLKHSDAEVVERAREALNQLKKK